MILFNFTNLRVGGGLQAAEAVFRAACLSEIEMVFLLPPSLKHLGVIPCRSIKVEKVDFAKKIFPNRHFDSLVEKYKVSVVITMFGPAYWRPRVPHLVGFAQGTYIYSDESFFYRQGPLYRWFVKMKAFLHLRCLLYEADAFHVETITVKQRLQSLPNFRTEKVFVVSNCCHDRFYTEDFSCRVFEKTIVDILCIGFEYRHKNLQMINKVVPILIEKGIKFRFHVTVTDSFFERNFFENLDVIKNHGKVFPNELVDLYKTCDVTFLPSEIECFSASHLEGMLSLIPIVAVGSDFNRNLSGDRAWYFEANDYVNAAATLIDVCQLVITGKVPYEKLRQNREVAKAFGRPGERLRRLLDSASYTKRLQ